VPSNLESAWFGTQMCDLHVPVRPGGDVAFANAAVKLLVERNAIDEKFILEHTEGWEELVEALAAQPLDDLLEQAGLNRSQLDAFVDEYARADAAILLWSMGITQHREAVDGVRGIVNLALTRGNVGRDGAGLMPLRGHSGVQGGAEMGAYATALPGGLDVDEKNAASLAERWGFYNKLCEPAAVLADAQAAAKSLADGPTFAHAMTKKCIHQEWNMGIDEAIEAEAQAQAICMQTKDYERAYLAFVNKQRPTFAGN